MDAIILAGGFGTRLQRVVRDIPKPLAPIGNTPFLEFLLNQLSGSSYIDRYLFAVGYKHEQIMKWVQDTHPHLSHDFSIENEPLGTGGALKQAFELAHSDIVLVCNGDSFFNINIDQMISEFQEKRADIMLAYREEKEEARYGTIDIDSKSQKISAFLEKVPRMPSFVNGGIYLMKKDIFADLDFGEKFSLETDGFPKLTNKRFYGYFSKAEFIDIGTESSYELAQTFLDNYRVIK